MSAKLSVITIDCADPAGLAGFYAELFDGKVESADADSAQVAGGPVGLGFQRVEGYRAPAWPQSSGQLHFDIEVDDVAAAVTRLTAAGATVPDAQPGGADWTVLLDPEGHPFCVFEG